ncbi:Neuronal PAS domain-containing protein 4, partial [Operophtera brumata]
MPIPTQVLLATALVEAQTRHGSSQMLRVLLDHGSQASFITESAVQLLGLKKKSAKTVISGIGGEKSSFASRFEPTKSTKGASKMRRDLINAEISNLRDLLPLPPSTRQRLSQLQLMALVCVYVRKMNYFQQVFKSHDFSYQYQEQASPTPNIGFSK